MANQGDAPFFRRTLRHHPIKTVVLLGGAGPFSKIQNSIQYRSFAQKIPLIIDITVIEAYYFH
jgi:hypothetical protein